MWLKTARHKDPKCKSKEQFDIAQLHGLLSDLKKLWPFLKNDSYPAAFCNLKKHGITPHASMKYDTFVIYELCTTSSYNEMGRQTIVPTHGVYNTLMLIDTFEAEFDFDHCEILA
ncbi:unnamed protein product [Schistosoma mattheei]|uniref:Uncharacterized protein n=1 Tax=Schistosoma mattheei TaxID=31246 RepID=A0A183P0Q5_9TREM|nr:unnamed protein product [Schistosoma mattheei]